MKSIRFLSAVALLVASLHQAFAADPVFPPGSRVGLTPLVGLVPSKAFAGFESEDHGVKVLVAELPAEAYNEVAKAFKSDTPGTAAVHPAEAHAEPYIGRTPNLRGRLERLLQPSAKHPRRLQLAGRGMTRQTSLPFGPFLAIGLLLTLILQQFLSAV